MFEGVKCGFSTKKTTTLPNENYFEKNSTNPYKTIKLL